MKSFLVYIALAFLVCSPAHAQSVVFLELSTWEEVVAAVNEINSRGEGSISLGKRIDMLVDRQLPDITGDLTIDGNGVTLKPSFDNDESDTESVETYDGFLALIDETGRLKISDLHITGFERTRGIDSNSPQGFIDNRGTLNLERVTFANNPLNDYEQPKTSARLLHNAGSVLLHNVTFFGNDTYLDETIVNEGSMTVTSTTIAENKHLAIKCIGSTCFMQSAEYAVLSNLGAMELGNVLLDDSTVYCWNHGQLRSLGGNFFDNNNCNLDPTVNAVHGSANLGSFGYHGGLVPTVGLEPGSAAIDAGLDKNCTATDARFANRPASGSIHSAPKCDAGAFEYGGGFGNSDLAASGMNGLWFSQASDGHYVHVWRISPDRVYVNWTAFDETADQMWIYAVAETTGKTQFTAKAHINEGGQLIPGGAPEGSTVKEWGEIEIEFESCTVGTFRYEALDEGIGSGEFQIDRLAFIEGGGCSE